MLLIEADNLSLNRVVIRSMSVKLRLTASRSRKEEPIAATAWLCVSRRQTPRPDPPGSSLRPTQAPLSFETED
jgi:hypothetical protein